MKKVLILSSKPPYPLQDGAAIRTHQSIRLFSELGYVVDVLYLSEYDDRERVRDGLRGLCRHIIHFTMTRHRSYMKVLLGLLTNLRPLQVNYFYSYRAQRWIDRHAADYDLVYCNNIRTAQYARRLKNLKIIDYVDAYSKNYQAARNQTRGIWHWIYTIDFPRCERYEQKILGEFDKRLIISEVDRQHILAHASRQVPVSVIENYTPIVDGKRIENGPDGRNLMFIGAMNYEPNVSAVKYFAQNVLPTLSERYPDIRFYIVGKTPTHEVTALADEHTIVTGFVENMWDYLQKATLIVTPMQSGSGLQNKILQSLAVGACVVTTPIGFEGLVEDEGQPFVASTPQEMIDCICHLLEHPEERKQQGELSVAYVKKHYDIEVIKEKFSRFLNE